MARVLLAFSLLSCKPSVTVSGIVRDKEGPVAGATVRIQATENATLTDAHGRFTLSGLGTGQPVTVNAWKHTYYCTLVKDITPPATDILINIASYQTDDNPDYPWIPPTGQDACITCHLDITEIWLKNAHAGAATNQRFFSMYNGTDIYGNQSPDTRFSYRKDYGVIPLPPDPAQPYFGPGYKLDFPNSAGNCAACHIPGAAVDSPYEMDPSQAANADKFGIHCDYCHKVAGVTLDEATGLPHANRPGVLSTDIRRPFTDGSEQPQLFFGPLDDPNAAEGDAYLPLMSKSQFCAPCHFGVFWDVVVYNSFGEWLESPYSDAKTGKTCQQCHMPAPTVSAGRVMTNMAPGNGGIDRDPSKIHAHLQLGAQDQEFMENALSMSASASFENKTVMVQVTLSNDNTGHHVPTGSPLRHLILLVSAKDAQGRALTQLDGPKVPEWGGAGDPDKGYYGGLPGQGYAKILEELWTQVVPTGSYWNHTRLVSDNRIPAMAEDHTTYTFDGPDNSDISITVTLLYRRAFKNIQDQKKWNTPDMVMARQQIVIKPEAGGQAKTIY